MRRVQYRGMQPPLRYILSPKPNKIMRMKEKVAGIANIILGYFNQYSKNKNIKIYNTHDVNSGSPQIQHINQDIVRYIDQQKCKKIITKSALNIIKFSEISSQSDNEDQVIQTMKTNLNYQTTMQQKTQLQQSKVASLHSHNNIFNKQLMQQKSKINKQQNSKKVIVINKQALPENNKKQSHDLSYSNSSNLKSEDSLQLSFNQNSMQLGRKRQSRPMSIQRASDMMKGFEIHEQDSQDQAIYNLNAGQLPKKRLKLLNQRYLKYAQNLSNKKTEILKNIQSSSIKISPNDMKKQEKQQKIENTNLQKHQPLTQTSQLIQKLQSQLDAINARKNNNRLQTFTPQFQPVSIQSRPKKLDLNLQKILQIVRELKIDNNTINDASGQQVANTDQKAISNSVKFTGLGFNSSSLSPKINLILNNQNKTNEQLNNPFANFLSSNKQQNNKIEPSVVSQTKKNETKNVPVDKQQSQNDINQQSSKQNLDKYKNQQSILSNKQDPKPPKLNPFMMNTQDVKLLPTLQNILFPKNNGTAVSGNSGTQLQDNKGGFSTPVKNIYQKYPDAQQNQAILERPIPQSQQDQSSMPDQSEHSASRKDQFSHSPIRGMSQVSQPFNSNSGSLLGGQSFLSQPGGLFSSLDPKGSFFSIPKIDIKKSMQMFGRPNNINPNSSDALWGTQYGESGGKKPDIPKKNNRKKNQQRAYA